jgi:hypothetical protein
MLVEAGVVPDARWLIEKYSVVGEAANNAAGLVGVQLGIEYSAADIVHVHDVPVDHVELSGGITRRRSHRQSHRNVYRRRKGAEHDGIREIAVDQNEVGAILDDKTRNTPEGGAYGGHRHCGDRDRRCTRRHSGLHHMNDIVRRVAHAVRSRKAVKVGGIRR